MAVHQDDGRRTVEGGLSRQHLVEKHAQGVKVGLVADRRCSADLLGGHVGRRPQGSSRGRELGGAVQVLGDPEIGQLELAVAGDHQVRWFEIPMHDAQLVGVMQGVAELDRQFDDLPPGKLPTLLENPLESDPLDELHGEVGRALEAAPRQPANDVGMAELLEDLGLALEPLENLPFLAEFAA